MLPAEGLTGSVIQSITGSALTKAVHFYAVDKDDIREAVTKRPLQVSEHDLFLVVPHRNPLAATLTIDDNQRALDFLARPTPAPQDCKKKPVVELTVSDDGRFVTSNVGHSVFAYHLSGEARMVRHSSKKYEENWTIQLGPFAEHTIGVAWHNWPNRGWTITVDGEMLVDSHTKGERSDGVWECDFSFVGEKLTDCEVHGINREGTLLVSKGHVLQRDRTVNRCAVKVDFKKGVAQLLVDDVKFEKLPLQKTAYEEAPLRIERAWLYSNYGFQLPLKVNYEAPIGLVGGLRAAGNSDPNALPVTQRAAGKAGSTLVASSFKAGSELLDYAATAATSSYGYAATAATSIYDQYEAQSCKAVSQQKDSDDAVESVEL